MWKYLGDDLTGFCWDLEGLHATGSNNDMWVDLAATNWQLAASYKPQPQIALPLPSFTKIENPYTCSKLFCLIESTIYKHK